MDNEENVIIFSNDATEDVQDFDLLGDVKGGVVSLRVLEENIAEVGPALQRVVECLKRTVHGTGLSEVTVAIGMNAKGKVGFLGTGSELGGSATLTLKFSTK